MGAFTVYSHFVLLFNFDAQSRVIVVAFIFICIASRRSKSKAKALALALVGNIASKTLIHITKQWDILNYLFCLRALSCSSFTFMDNPHSHHNSNRLHLNQWI